VGGDDMDGKGTDLEYHDEEEATTSLAGLLAGIKLDD